MGHYAAQPSPWPAASVENSDRTHTSRTQDAELFFYLGPQLPIGVGVRTAETKQSLGISIGIVDVVVAGLVVDSGREPTGDPWRWVSGVD
jgi:hypothetical protein